MPDQDLQLTLDGKEEPVDRYPCCDRTDTCQADVDEHAPECPVEQQLRDTFGF